MGAQERLLISKFCDEKNKIRETLFSETYRAPFKLNKEYGVWEITNIRIPFKKRKEAALKEKFGLNDEELAAFYVTLRERIRSERDIFKAMKSWADQHAAENIISYQVYKGYDIEEGSESGRDYYFISRPVDPILESVFLSDPSRASITLLELVTLGIQLTEIIRFLNKEQVYMAAWDMDTIYVDSDSRVMIGSLLYAKYAGQGQSQLVTLPSNASEVVRQGNAASLGTELYSIGALLWNLSNGSLWSITPDFSENPKYATTELQDVLNICLKGNDNDLDAVQSRLNRLADRIREDPDKLNTKIPIAQLPQESPKNTPVDSMDVPTDQYAENLMDTKIGPCGGIVGETTGLEVDNGENYDPFLSGMEIVEASFDPDESETDGISQFEMLDIPIEFEDEGAENRKATTKGHTQRTPLRPKRSIQHEDDEEDDSAPKSKKRVITSVVVAALVLVIGFSAWKAVYLKHEPGDATVSQVQVDTGEKDDPDKNISEDQSDAEDVVGLPEEEMESTEGTSTTEESLCTDVEDDEKKEEETTTTTVVATKPSSAGASTSSTASKPAASSHVSSNASTSGGSSSGGSSSNSSSSRPNTNTRPSTSTSNSTASRPSTSNSSRPTTGTTSRPSNSSGSTSANRPSTSTNRPSTSTGSSSSSTSSRPSNSGSAPSSGGSSSSASSNPNTSTAAQRPIQKSFIVSPGSVAITVGGSVSLSANAPCSFSSSNSGVAYVSGRSVVGVAPGTCTIIAVSSVDGSQRTIVVSVS